MVKTFTGTRGGKRNKNHVRKKPSNDIDVEVPVITETERAMTIINEERAKVIEGVTTPAEEEVMTMNEERVTVGDGETTLGKEAGGDKHGNNEERVESNENSSVERDDCEVIVEDRDGYRESHPVR